MNNNINSNTSSCTSKMSSIFVSQLPERTLFKASFMRVKIRAKGTIHNSKFQTMKINEIRKMELLILSSQFSIFLKKVHQTLEREIRMLPQIFPILLHVQHLSYSSQSCSVSSQKGRFKACFRFLRKVFLSFGKQFESCS